MVGGIRKIGVFALSNAPDAKLLKKGCDTLAEFTGAEIVCNCLTAQGPRRLAGEDNDRAERFNQLLKDESIDMLIAARGGYGVTRILEKIDFRRLRDSGKWLCGYSDVSALLLAAWKNGCRRLIHGPMVCSAWANVQSSKECVTETKLFCKTLEEETSSENREGRLNAALTLKRGNVTAPLIPANLSMLNALLGTPFLPDLSGTILAIEDVNEPAHAIDRKLNQLRQNSILDSLKGMVFGHFTDAQDGEFIPEILQEYTQFIHGPVIMDFPLGHDHPSTPLIVGKNYILDAD